MKRVIVDESIAKRFAEAADAVQVCTSAGDIVGYFTPSANPSIYDQLEVALFRRRVARTRAPRRRTSVSRHSSRPGTNNMTFTVLWTPRAETNLAQIWTAAADRNKITRAVPPNR